VKRLSIALATAMIIVSLVLSYLSLSLTPKAKVVIRVSTTTSLYVTGLLDHLAEELKKRYPEVEVVFISVGSGAALELAAKGDVDVVMVHAPSLEKKYIERGVIVNGAIFAYNYFVLVGPSEDPARVKGLEDIVEAFKRIYQAGELGHSCFVSRGDMSGTHVRELMIWNMTGLNPKGRLWYVESGTGMSKTLMLADNLKAYTLSDIGTFLKLKKEGVLKNLVMLVSRGSLLINVYSIHLVNPSRYEVNKEYARRWMEFILSDDGQELIASYGKDKYGVALFNPAKGRSEELKKMWKLLSEGRMIGCS